MIQIYKNYEGHKELEELDHIELESWVMITDPTMEELMNISRDYKIDMDDLKAALDTEERSRLGIQKAENRTFKYFDERTA